MTYTEIKYLLKTTQTHTASEQFIVSRRVCDRDEWPPMAHILLSACTGGAGDEGKRLKISEVATSTQTLMKRHSRTKTPLAADENTGVLERVLGICSSPRPPALAAASRRANPGPRGSGGSEPPCSSSSVLCTGQPVTVAKNSEQTSPFLKDGGMTWVWLKYGSVKGGLVCTLPDAEEDAATQHEDGGPPGHAVAPVELVVGL